MVKKGGRRKRREGVGLKTDQQPGDLNTHRMSLLRLSSEAKAQFDPNFYAYSKEEKKALTHHVS